MASPDFTGKIMKRTPFRSGANLSRDGRYISWIDDFDILSVYSTLQTSNASSHVIGQVLWKASTVRCALWHYEEPIVLVLKKNGTLEWKSFFPECQASQHGVILVDHLLRLLVSAKLEFNCLNSINILSYQHNHLTLQTSSRQIVVLELLTDSTAAVSWAYVLSEFEICEVSDRCFLVFEPHGRHLSFYSLFSGKLRKKMELKVPEHTSDHKVQKVCSSPDRKHLAILTSQLYLGEETNMELVDLNGQHVMNMSMGDENIALVQEQSPEYLLYNYSSRQVVHKYSIRSGETLLLCQRFNRLDKIWNSTYISELSPPIANVTKTQKYAYDSMLSNALASHHFESCANILKLSGDGSQTDLNKILEILNSFIKANFSQSFSSFFQKVVGASLRFACQAYQKHPSCSRIMEFIFNWQDILLKHHFKTTINIQEETPSASVIEDDVDVILQNSILKNCLPLGQQSLINQGKYIYRNFDAVRQTILDHTVETINTVGKDFFENAADLLRNLGYSVDSWERLVIRIDSTSTRRNFVDYLIQRDLCNPRLASFVNFLDLIEKHDSNVPASQALKSEALKRWEKDESQSFLAEIYFQEKDASFIPHLEPREVWMVMIKQQILSGLRKWVDIQFASEAPTNSIPYCWPINDEMIDLVAESHSYETKETILNLLAFHGVVASSERQTLEKLIARLLKSQHWGFLEVILQKPKSNLSYQELVSIIVSYSNRQRKIGLLWDVLNFTNISSQSDVPAWMAFILELHHNKGFLSASSLEVAIRLNCHFLQEDRTLLRTKFPSLTTGAIFSACIQGDADQNAFSFYLSEQTFESPQNFENKATPFAPKIKAATDRMLNTPLSWDTEKDHCAKSWFHLVPHLRPVEIYCRIKNSGTRHCESTKFSLTAAYSYGIAKQKDTLRGIVILLLRMCKIECMPLDSYLNKQRSISRRRIRLGTKEEAATKNLPGIELHVYEGDTKEAESEYHLNDETLNECLKSLVIVHEEQPHFLTIEEERKGIQAQSDETIKSLLRNFLVDRLQSSSPTVSSWQLLHGIITNSASELLLLTDAPISLPGKRTLELMMYARVMTEYAQSLTCLFIYIAAQMPRNLKRHEPEPSVDAVCDVILQAVQLSKFDVVVEAFNVITPGHLLTYMLNWLDSYTRNIPKAEEELLTDIVRSSKDRTEQLTFPVFCKMFHPTPLFLSSFCKFVVRDVRKQLELLLGLARATMVFPVLGEVFPNITHLTVIATACIEFRINIKTSALLSGNSSVDDFKRECEEVIKVLLRRKEFNRALEVAKSCGLPIDSILVSQLSSNLRRLLNSIKPDFRSRSAFWSRCSNLFVDHRVRPEVASAFFMNSSKQAVSQYEKHAIIDHSLCWARRITKPTAEDEECVVKLEVSWWESKIEADTGESIYVSEELTASSSRQNFPMIRAKLEEIAMPFSRHSCANYSAHMKEEILKLIGLKLDNEDLFEAFKLSVIFKIDTKDLSLILLLMRMVESPSEYNQFLEEAKEIVPFDDSVTHVKDRFAALETIAGLVSHGRPICDRLLVFYHVAVALDMSYTYVVEHKKPLCILKMLVEHSASSNLKFIPGLGGLFNLASRWAAASNISPSEIVLFVRDELIETVRCAQSKICDTEASMVISLLQGTFNRWVTLCKELTQLGVVLMASSLDLQKSGEWGTAVEVLIFAHSSFTLACNVESIRQVLNQARSFIDKLAAEKNWALITRLLTGLQRYAEMNYVFTLLKEADQFEYFLRKGMDRLPLLRQALLDFLRPSSSKNRELFRLVALHFHMHAEVASLWKEEANLLVEPVIRQAHGSARAARKPSTTPLKPTALVVKQSSVEYSQRASSVVTVPKINIDQETKNKLLAAMHDLAHAAEYFVQAGKLDHANDCVLTAELYALQLSVLNNAKSEDKDAVCVLGLTASQVNHLIDHSLTYSETEILSRAYGVNISWGRTLFYHYVINGEVDFLNQFKRRQDLSPVVVEELLTAFQSEVDCTNQNPELFDRIAKILSAVPDVELSYRIGSRLSLVPLVTGILSSPSLSFLKDKVWGSV